MKKKLKYFLVAIVLEIASWGFPAYCQAEAIIGGTSTSDAPLISSSATEIKLSGDGHNYFKFIPSQDGTYIITTLPQSVDTEAYLYYDASQSSGKAADRGDYHLVEFYLTDELQANHVYYLKVYEFYGSARTCTLTITGGGLKVNHCPTVTIADPGVDRIYKDSQIFTVSGSINDSDGDNVTVSALINGQSASTIVSGGNGTWTLSWNTADIPEGVYREVVFTVSDESGATGTAQYTGNIVVDKTAPTASVTYTKNPAKEGDLLTITATFSEALADFPRVLIAVSGANSLPATDMTKISATQYTFDYTVGTGNGAVTVFFSSGADVAGNVVLATPIEGAGFMVDNTEPAAPTFISLADQPDTAWNDGYLSRNDISSNRVLRVSLPAFNQAEAGDMLRIDSESILIGCKLLNNTDIFNGYADVVISSATLADFPETTRTFTAGITDLAGNIGGVSESVSAIVDKTPPTLVGAVRTDSTHLTIVLSEKCYNLDHSNNGGFTVNENGGSNFYEIVATAGGVDDCQIILTVPDLKQACSGGVIVKYGAGADGTVQDRAGNLMIADNVGITVTAWDTVAPTISRAVLDSGNGYMDILFSEGVYGANNAINPLTTSHFTLIFSANGGTVTDVFVTGVRKADNKELPLASVLTGGETTVRVFLGKNGIPSGAETVEIGMSSIYPIYDRAGNAMSLLQTTGAKILTDQLAPAIAGGNLAESNQYIDVAFSEGVYGTGSGAGAVSASQLQVTFGQNGGTASGVQIHSLKRADNPNENSASTLTGGETIIRAFLTITGNPSGVETLSIEPARGAPVYDLAGNAIASTATTGSQSLHPVTLKLAGDQIFTETNLATSDIQVAITGATLKDSSLEIENFTLRDAAGLRVARGIYVDPTHCTLRVTGSLNGNLESMGLTIKAPEISSGYDLTSSNTIKVIDDLPTGKTTITIGADGDNSASSNNRWYTAESYQNDLRTVWNGTSLHLGKGTSGSSGDLWLYNPGMIGTAPGQIEAGTKIDRAQLILKILSISGEANKPRRIKIYQIEDPGNLGKPCFMDTSSEGLRLGLDYQYRDHRPGQNIPWSDGAQTIGSSSNAISLLDCIEFIPRAFTQSGYDSIRLDVTDAVKAWVNNPHLNQGLYITIDDTTWNAGEQVVLYGLSSDSANGPKLQIYLSAGEGKSPNSPAINASAPGDEQVALACTLNNPTGDTSHSIATGYRILRKNGVTPADPEDGILIFDGISSAITDSNLENGQIYYYAAFAYDADRNYSRKSYVQAIPGDYSTAPAAPADLTYKLAGRDVALSWIDKATNEKEYLIFRDSTQIATLKANQTGYCDRNAPSGTYTYKVRAGNSQGSSEAITGPVNVPNLPDAPADLAWSVISSSEVQLRWTQAADTSYRVEILNENGILLWSEWATVSLSTDSGIIRYPVMRLIVTVGYRFRVVAVKASLENAAETDVVKTTADPKPIFL